VKKPNRTFGMEEFAKNLKKRAAEMKISNAEAARRCELEERRYANYINNSREPDLGTLAKIATKLSVSVDWLLGLTEKRPTTAEDDLIERLAFAAKSLPLDKLEMIVTQVEALTPNRPKPVGRKVSGQD
jgi:transcriptional regulator with XRE-family HTH domain